MHTGFVCWFLSSGASVTIREFGETSLKSLTVRRHRPSGSPKVAFTSSGSALGSPFDSEFWECFEKSLLAAVVLASSALTVTATPTDSCIREFWECFSDSRAIYATLLPLLCSFLTLHRFLLHKTLPREWIPNSNTDFCTTLFTFAQNTSYWMGSEF